VFIDKVFPAVVGDRASLRNRLAMEATARGLTNEQANTILAIVPEPLINAGAFLDRMTGLWRYEFGLPYNIAENLVWGTHMWVTVDCLFRALYCAHLRLPMDKRTIYLQRLADPDAHQATLVEMVPVDKIATGVPVEFEIAGLGAGNRTLDWVIGLQGGRTVLLDVKRRTTDFIQQAERMDNEGEEPVPEHDPALLFRSVEQKFVSADPGVRLQGVWILIDIKQEEEQLGCTFAALDGSKVHFAILGDWEQDAHILVRRDEDRQSLVDLFHIESSTRFTFRHPEPGLPT